MESTKELANVQNNEIVEIANKLIEDCIVSAKRQEQEKLTSENTSVKNSCQLKTHENDSPNEIEIQVIEETQVNNKNDEVVTPKEGNTATSSEDESVANGQNNVQVATPLSSETLATTTENVQVSSTQVTSDEKSSKKQKKPKKEKKSKEVDTQSNGTGKLIEGEAVKRKESIGVKIKRAFTLGKSESKKVKSATSACSSEQTQPSANGSCKNGDVAHANDEQKGEQENAKDETCPTQVTIEETKVVKSSPNDTVEVTPVVEACMEDKLSPTEMTNGEQKAVVSESGDVANGTLTSTNDKLGKLNHQNCIII